MLNKTIIFTALLFGTTLSFAADSKIYTQNMSNVAKIEASLAKCIPDEDESTNCYNNAEKEYDKIIVNIRKTYGNKIDSKLWQAINLGSLTRKQNCRSKELDAGTSQIFYPYIDCVHSANHSLVITAIELHLK